LDVSTDDVDVHYGLSSAADLTSGRWRHTLSRLRIFASCSYWPDPERWEGPSICW